MIQQEMNKMAIHTHVIFRPDDIKKKRRKKFVEQGTGITYSGVGRCQKVGGGGGGGAQRHVIYVPLVKNQYKRVVFGYMIIYSYLTAICVSLLKLSTR